MTYYNADIQRDNWSNETPSFTEMDTSFSPAYKGKNFTADMEKNKSLFYNNDEAKDIYKDVHLINPTDSVANLDFAIQQKQWQALNNSLSATRTNSGSPTRLIGFDFETLRVNNPNYLDKNSAITELGITETIIKKKSVKSVNSYSIAFGINQEQLKQYLEDIKQVKDKGLNSFGWNERNMIRSELERLSRYSGNIDDVFGMSHITNIGDVVTIKSLGSSKGLDLNAIERGLINLSVLGGISVEDFEKNVLDAGYTDVNTNTYSAIEAAFDKAGLKKQTLNTKITAKQTLKDRVVKYFNKQRNKKNTFITGYNINNFDIPIYNQLFGNNLTKKNTVDAYTAIQYVSGNKDIQLATQIAERHGFVNTGFERRSSQEGIAHALGITFEDTAHNAASDTKVSNEIIANKNFYKFNSLASLASNAEAPKISYFEPNENTVLYALNSIAFDKNGLDYLENASRLEVSGIQRGRYYSIGAIKQFEDGKVGVEFNSAASGTNNTFVKVFNSLEDMQSTIKQNFIADDINKVTQKAIDLNDYIVNADKARRNYEDLFSIRSITYNINTKTYDGGYEKLNQYYKAYNQTIFELEKKGISINDSVIKEIAETNKYDSEIISSLKSKEAFNISDDKEVYKSLLRDFKAGFGKIHDEASLIEYINSQFEGIDFDNYQKTVVANNIRENLIKDVENYKVHKEGVLNQFVKDIPNDLYAPSRRDMFAMDINMGGDLVNIEFQNRENAINVLTKNFYSKTGKNANTMQVATNIINSVNNLYENEIVGYDFLKSFYETAGVENTDTLNIFREVLSKQGLTINEIDKEIKSISKHVTSEIQPRKMVEMLVSEIQNNYIAPLLNTDIDFNYTDFINKDYSKLDKLPNKDKIINFLNNKSEIKGSKVLYEARNNKYHRLLPGKIGNEAFDEFTSVGDIFRLLLNVKHDNIQEKTNKIMSNASNMQMTLNKSEIKKQLMKNLNYSEEAADEIDRMLFLNRKEKGPFGLTTYESNGKRTDFITQFAYSGKQNEDAFILLNFNEDTNSNLAKVMETMEDTKLSFEDKIKLIKENNYAAVFQLPAINKYDINIDTKEYNDPFFSLTGINGDKTNYSFSTIETGEKGFQKISQSHLSFYDHGVKNGDDTLSNLDITLTDDADMINSAYRKTRQSLLDIYQNTSLSTTEKYSKITKLFKRAQNRVITNMPGPSGYQTLFVNGKYQKIFAPNIADIMQSTQLNVRAFEILALETAKQDVLNNKTKIADNILTLAGETTDDNHVKKLEKLINRVKDGHSVSEEFDEYFLKHFASVPMGMENNFKITGAEADFTFIDYIKNRLDKGYDYTKKTQDTINWLASNKDRISQIIKEKATHDKKISLLDLTMLNEYGVFDSSIRPVNTQQPTARKFLPERVREQIGEEIIKKLQIQIGNDAMTTQKAELIDAFKNYDLGNGIKYGNLEDGITANYKQIDSAEIISKFKKIDNDFDDIFKTVYSDAATKFGISQQESKLLLQEAFNIMKNTSANVYESRGILRASFANNDLFLSPNIKTVEINPIEDLQLELLKINKKYKKMFETNHINTGNVIQVTNGGIERKYTGPSGHIVGDIGEFLTTGKGHLIEDTQGISSIKGYIGNEKFTAYVPEFDSLTSKAFDKVLRNNDSAKEAFIYYSDKIFDEVFGEEVSGVFDFPIIKHNSFGVIEGNYLNRIFYNVNKYISETGDNNLFTELSDIFTQADPNGIRLVNYKGNITYDQTLMKENGAFTQVDNILKIINEKALNSSDKYQNIWKTILDEIDKSDIHQIFRGTFHVGVNNESMGGAINLDPRMETNFRSKFMEEIDEYFTLEEGWDNFNAIEKANGEKVTVFNYIADEIYKESTDGLKDTSKTPIDKMYGLKRKSALNTVKGIELSTQYMNSPENLVNSDIILDIKLDDINLAPSGSEASELTKTGVYKLIDGNEVKYSNQIEQIAKAQGKNINDIVAFRIDLGDGITFDNFGIKENGKLIKKKIDKLIIPFYDITPFKGEVQYTDVIRDLNKVLKLAKNYGIEKGLDNSKEILNEAVQKLYITLASELDYTNKNSYVVSKTLKIPMKNSGMLHAESSIVPTVNAIVDNYDTWISKDASSMRAEIIQAIREGDINYDIDIASSSLTGRKYTTVRDGVLYYDDIVEMSKEGFVQKGIDFKETGKQLFFYKDDYRPYIKEMNNSFFDKDYAKQIIDSGIETDEVKKAMESLDEYNTLLYKLKNRKKFEEKIFKNLLEKEEFSSGKPITDKDEIKVIRKKAKEYYINIKSDINLLNKEFEKITEDYLTEVGTFGLGSRYPTFMEDSTGVVVFKLNNHLRKDEMVVSGVFGHKINMDHDGDKGVIKLMLDKSGNLLSRANEKLYSAFNKAYEMQVYNLRNNEVMADFAQKSSDKIEESTTRIINGKEYGSAVDPISDLAHNNITMRKAAITSNMQEVTRNNLLTEIKLDNLIGVDISDYTNEEINLVFNAWDKKYGNLVNNTENIAAAIKAKITKGEIGSVSNINYTVNQVLYESMKEALDKGDTEAKAKYNRIKTDLHIGNMGLLPETEQKAIDVKHSYQGLSISETRKYNQGVIELFEGHTDNGQRLIKEAMSSKFEEEKLNKFISSITELSKDDRARIKFNYRAPSSISTINQALDYIEKLQYYTKYAKENGLVNDTAIKSVYNTMSELQDILTMGYYHNNVLQTLYEDNIFISTQDGNPILYRLTEKKTNKDLSHKLTFDTFDLTNGTLNKGKINWTSNGDIIEGTTSEVQTLLQNKFGDFRAYNIAEITNSITAFRKQIKNELKTVNTNKFAQMYSRGNTEMANKFLEELKSNSINKDSVKQIKEYMSLVNQQDFDNFINKAEFIKNNTRYQKVDMSKSPSIINDLLTDINKQIIELGKNKKAKTKTSVENIFDNALKQIATNVGMDKLNTEEFKNFAKTNHRLSSDVFEGYEEKMVDIRKAEKELNAYTDSNDKIDNVLNKYKQQNKEYLDSLDINPSTTSDLDNVFNWNSDSLEDMRVGIKTKNGLYGRKFADLSDKDIEEIMKTSNKDADSLTQYAYNTTKSKLMEYQKNGRIANTSGLQGASSDDINNILKSINEEITQEGTDEAIKEGMNAKGKKLSKEHAGKLLKKTLNGIKDFSKTTPGKITMGLAALGLVSNMMDSGSKDSPLSPELNQKETTGPINNDSNNISTKAPSSNTGRKTVYADSSSGLHFKMSAKSKNKIDQMKMANQLSAQTSGNTNVNIYDDRSQVSNNWLERKFSELM